MIIGYARVSTGEQKADLQIDKLKAYGCDRIFSDLGVSGIRTERPELDACLAALQPGDTLVVWKFDRLGRSLKHLVGVFADLTARKIDFVSLTEAIDTTTPAGRLMAHMLCALAEFERELIVERTNSGLQAAKERGVQFGRKPALTEQQIDMARRLVKGGTPGRKVAKTFGVGKTTLYKAIKEDA